METTIEITSHCLKALCNSSFFVISMDRWNKILRLSAASINQEHKFYGGRDIVSETICGWKIWRVSVKWFVNSNVISGRRFRGVTGRWQRSGKMINFWWSSSWFHARFDRILLPRVTDETINLSLCTIVRRSRYFFYLTIPLRNCYR